MNIIICFTGLVRTILETSENLKKHLLNNTDNFTILFVTWESENVDDFVTCFPNSIIYKIQDIYKDNNIQFDEWCKNTIMSRCWIHAHQTNKNALFIYYRQIYLWDKAANILENFNNIDNFDIAVRARTDILVNNEFVHNYYNYVTNSNIFFPNEPRFSLVSDFGCPDYIFLGNPKNVIKLLKIRNSINHLYNKYNIPIQPETTMHFMLLDNMIEKIYMNNNIQIIRQK